MRKLALILIALALGVLALTPTMALAHHTDGHDGGPPGGSSETTTTEDDDGDGQANCPDPEGDADNRHPSGKDKHCEAGGSGNQGDAQSDPDDDGRGPDRGTGGADQPGGEGGQDLLDQDGNNGCGNDDDFEDDNEGWCGKPDRDQDASPENGEVGGEQGSRDVCEDDMSTAHDECAPAQGVDEVAAEQDQQIVRVQEGRVSEGAVAGERIERGSAEVGSTVGSAGTETAVLGIQLERAPSAAPEGAQEQMAAAPSALARTGVPAALLALAGLGFVTAGYGLRRRG